MVPKKVYMFYFLAYLVGLPRLIRKEVLDLITPRIYQNLSGISKRPYGNTAGGVLH